jgi:iron uptake system component EfeO
MPRASDAPSPRRPLLVLGLAVLPALGACVSNTPAGATGNTIEVESSATACVLSATTAPSGTVTFRVKNTGDDVTEFYLLGEDKLRVVSEVENIGPGLTREMVVQARPGTYHTECKPGMAGDGIMAEFTVTDSGASIGPAGDIGQQLAAATDTYVEFVRDEADTLFTGTTAFADAYRSGDDDAARELYAKTRVNWERIEPVAESFGDLDPLLDAREADLEEGQAWTGWHRIEKDLWPPAADANGGTAYVPLTPEERAAAADDLVKNTQALVDKVNASEFTFEAFQIANGAKELLDEVASGKVTGEEEIWSHTDLWDLQANVDGAEMAFEVLENVARARDAELVEDIEARFDALIGLLATHGSYDAGFERYDELTRDEVQALAAAVDALGEPLSKLTSTITGAG